VLHAAPGRGELCVMGRGCVVGCTGLGRGELRCVQHLTGVSSALLAGAALWDGQVLAEVSYAASSTWQG